MLRVNVGMSRKLSKDYNSTGFSINLEGELCVALDDPEAVIEKIREYYDLADEALRDQVERHESDTAIASRDEKLVTNQGRSRGQSNSEDNGGRARDGNGRGREQEPATNKQVQYLLNIGKRQGLTTPQLENRIKDIIGQRCGVYDLSKRDAGLVLDTLTENGNGNGSRQQNRR